MSGVPDPSISRITPDEDIDKVAWGLGSEPSLGKPVRTIFNDEKGNPIREEWSFKVALGGKEHNVWVDGKSVGEDNRDVRTVRITLKPKDKETAQARREKALGIIKDLQSKFARLGGHDARELYQQIEQGKITKLHVVTIKSSKKGPAVGLCVVWPGENDALYCLFHDYTTHQVYRRDFPPGSSVKSVEADLAQMFHLGREVVKSSWNPFSEGTPVEGEAILRLDKMRHRGKHERLQGRPGYEQVAPTRQQTVQERLAAMPIEERVITATDRAMRTAEAAAGAGVGAGAGASAT